MKFNIHRGTKEKGATMHKRNNGQQPENKDCRKLHIHTSNKKAT